ncbi:phosphotransferase family protein [Verrucosispora sp. WMMC514]|uniref:phosphotransferase family protein n=1 Tax=Verrucosispora sp. WMMC514 TaxID=3015156 RepID=UPI00248BFC13|nr:phosphotransferase family protein [Verrucosispora sp. WMMC514]WBB89868.1 phosphotransferase family protein [Verrucosispora sp. WMMC514]
MSSQPRGLPLEALQRYFTEHVPEVRGPVEAEILHGGRSNLTYLLTDGYARWVLRRPPLGGLTPSAHDMSREYRVVAALHGTGVPVARPVTLCEDVSVIGVPFSVVEHVAGQVLRSRTDLSRHDDGDVERCAFTLIDGLARLHDLPYRDIGLADFGRPQGYLRRQVDRWYSQWQRVTTRELTDIEKLRGQLAEDGQAESGASVVHGDYRIDNTILDEQDIATVRAVVDWEMATLGDPLADLGLHLVYRDPAFEPVLVGSAASVSERMPSVQSLAERYARASGRDLGRLEYYLALGYFKIAVIAEGIHARYRHGLTVGDGFETVGAAVPELVAGGLRALQVGRPS